MKSLTKQQLEQYLIPDVAAVQTLFGDSYHRRANRVGKKLHQKLNTRFADTIRPNFATKFARMDDISELLNLANLLAVGQLYDINFMILRSAHDSLPAKFPSDVPDVDIAIMHKLHNVLMPHKYKTLGDDIYKVIGRAFVWRLTQDQVRNRQLINQLTTQIVLVYLIQQLKPGMYEIEFEETAVHHTTTILIDNLLYDLITVLTTPEQVLEVPELKEMFAVIVSINQLYQQTVHRDNDAGLLYMMERVHVIHNAATAHVKAASDPAEEVEWLVTITQQLIPVVDYLFDPSLPVPQSLIRYPFFLAGSIQFLKEQSSQHISWFKKRLQPFKKWQANIDENVNEYVNQFFSLLVLEEQRKGLLSGGVTQVRLEN